MVGAVIVAYNPDIQLLRDAYNSIKIDEERVVIVVNGPEKDLQYTHFKNIIYLGENCGIGKASNIGADWLKKHTDVSYFMFCDQDTIFPQNFFKELKSSISKTPNMIYAPKYFNKVIGKTETRIVLRVNNRIVVSNNCNLGDIYQVIASGMVINRKDFIELEGFNEDLFIDWVDMELCWRAWHRGIKIKLLDSEIRHQLGDSSLMIGRINIPLRNGIRYYYLIRNGIYLVLNFNHGGFFVKIWYLKKVLKEFIGYSIISLYNPRDLALILKGLIHGLINRLGKL